MQIQENFSLKHFNSFGIEVSAQYFAAFKSIGELTELKAQNSKLKTLILGGGSNILFTKNYEGLVLKNEMKGMEVIKQDDASVYVKVGAGENWHSLVMYAVDKGWGGLENLSLIPGSVGASPMQNIGAYGVEISSVFHELRAFHLKEKTNYTFSHKDCEFGYRDSVFKRKYRDQFVITDVTFRLQKNPVFNTTYGAVEKELETMGVRKLSIKAISDAVIRIRSSKLPSPKEIGNAGSFFKNPVISSEQYKQLQVQFPGIVGYDNGDGKTKLAAAWLIEHTGPGESLSWKGYRRGDAGCHEKQALVLVNYGNASGEEIYALAEEIRETVLDKFSVDLEVEVNVV